MSQGDEIATFSYLSECLQQAFETYSIDTSHSEPLESRHRFWRKSLSRWRSESIAVSSSLPHPRSSRRYDVQIRVPWVSFTVSQSIANADLQGKVRLWLD